MSQHVHVFVLRIRTPFLVRAFIDAIDAWAPINKCVPVQIKHKLAFAFGVAVFLAGLCGVAATTILWFSTGTMCGMHICLTGVAESFGARCIPCPVTGTLVAWLTLMSGAAVMAACVAVQVTVIVLCGHGDISRIFVLH